MTATSRRARGVSTGGSTPVPSWLLSWIRACLRPKGPSAPREIHIPNRSGVTAPRWWTSHCTNGSQSRKNRLWTSGWTSSTPSTTPSSSIPMGTSPRGLQEGCSTRRPRARSSSAFVIRSRPVGCRSLLQTNADNRTEADPRLQAEGFGGCRIEFDYAAGLRRGGGLQAAVGRARLDRLTSAWRPNPRHRLNVAHLPSLGTSPISPLWGLRGPSLRLKARGLTIPDGDTN